jgi:4a-hydroxytetrahydrobiopterin dehydratase
VARVLVRADARAARGRRRRDNIAVWVPEGQAEARVAAALAAGGRLVRDQFAPSWWTLADAAGNEVDIATTHGRDG